MGILDKNSRIVNMKMTLLGRELLSKGKFDVTFYKFFDDDVDYDKPEEQLINDTLVDEAISHSELTCLRSLSTVDLQDSKEKPYMSISKNTLTITKREQKGLIGEIQLVNVVDVYAEEMPQYETTYPIYLIDPNAYGASFVPLISDTSESDTGERDIVDGEDFPESINVEDDFFAEVDIEKLQSDASKIIKSILSIGDAEMIEAKLHGAKVQDGFRIEVFYSGTIDNVSGSTNLIKLSEYGIDPGYKSYYNSELALPPDVVDGYAAWFKIETINEENPET